MRKMVICYCQDLAYTILKLQVQGYTILELSYMPLDSLFYEVWYI